jgi:hypothetical protein
MISLGSGRSDTEARDRFLTDSGSQYRSVVDILFSRVEPSLYKQVCKLDDAPFCIILQSLFCSLDFCIDRNYVCQIYEFMDGKKLNARFTWI